MYVFEEAARTAKAPHSEKIKQLFNFFKDEEDNGINFIDFTKMVRSSSFSCITILAMN